MSCTSTVKPHSLYHSCTTCAVLMGVADNSQKFLSRTRMPLLCRNAMQVQMHETVGDTPLKNNSIKNRLYIGDIQEDIFCRSCVTTETGAMVWVTYDIRDVWHGSDLQESEIVMAQPHLAVVLSGWRSRTRSTKWMLHRILFPFGRNCLLIARSHFFRREGSDNENLWKHTCMHSS